jgi:flagellar protein FlgJ
MGPTDRVSPPGRAGAPDPELARIRLAAQDFEAIFLQTLLRTMRESVSQQGIFPRGNALKIFESLQDQEVARAMARGRGVGLADLLVQDLTRRRGGGKKASSRDAEEPMISAQPTAPAAGRNTVISEEGLK